MGRVLSGGGHQGSRSVSEGGGVAGGGGGRVAIGREQAGAGRGNNDAEMGASRAVPNRRGSPLWGTRPEREHGAGHEQG